MKRLSWFAALAALTLFVAACSSAPQADVEEASDFGVPGIEPGQWYTLRVYEYYRNEADRYNDTGRATNRYLSAAEDGTMGLTEGYQGSQNHFQFVSFADPSSHPQDPRILNFIKHRFGVVDTDSDQTIDLYRNPDSSQWGPDKQWRIHTTTQGGLRIVSFDNEAENRDYLLHQQVGGEALSWTDFTSRFAVDLPLEEMYWHLEPVAP